MYIVIYISHFAAQKSPEVSFILACFINDLPLSLAAILDNKLSLHCVMGCITLVT